MVYISVNNMFVLYIGGYNYVVVAVEVGHDADTTGCFRGKELAADYGQLAAHEGYFDGINVC